MTDVETRTRQAVEVLRRHGAVFAYLHGSRATGTAKATSDIDIAAHFGGRRPQAFEVLLSSGVDLLILDSAPLELAGRVATGGRLLFESDPRARVVWEATTRKIYFDELPRINRAHREFAETMSVVDEVRVLRLLRGVTDDLAVLRRESAATEGRRADPLTHCARPSAFGMSWCATTFRFRTTSSLLGSTISVTSNGSSSEWQPSRTAREGVD